jgi:hypothetical protein
MTEGGSRAGAARDVPPPRPVPPPAAAVPLDESGLARAARAVAEAVAGLVGAGDRADDTAGPGGTAAGGQRRPATTVLRDVVGAVAEAVGAAFGPGRNADEPFRPVPPPVDDAASTGDRSPGTLLGDLLAAAAPRLPIRDAGRLRQAHPGASDAEIADALVARAARLTAGIGAAAGGLSAAHWLAPASLLALPLELGAETVLIAGVEVVLLGELHELYGRPAGGDARTRGAAYLASWSAQRSVDGAGGARLGVLLGSAGIRALRRRMTRKLAGTIPSAAPLLVGAALAGRGNRRATESLAGRVLADLRAPRPVHPGSAGG